MLDTTVDYEESELRYSECNDEYDETAESRVQCVPVDFHVVFFWRVPLGVGFMDLMLSVVGPLRRVSG